MKTRMVFKLEKESKDYGQKFAPDCKINISKPNGIVYLDSNDRHPVGRFSDLSTNGEIVTAEIDIKEDLKGFEDRFQFSVEGFVNKKNEAQECVEITVVGVAADMPPRD